jgi:hypothetical protein
VALILRLYIATHFDLLAACCTAAYAHPTTSTEAASDRALCLRAYSRWPSLYEQTYPYGTRTRWSATLPAIETVLDLVPWSQRKNRCWWVLHMIQKACPQKYMKRGWTTMAKDACERARLHRGSASTVTDAVAECRLLVEIILCSLVVGGYSHAEHMCLPRRAISLWRLASEHPSAFATVIIRDAPDAVLAAWREALAWSLHLRPDVTAAVQAAYDWDLFHVTAIEHANHIRAILAADDEQAPPISLSLIMEETHRYRPRQQAAPKTRVLRSSALRLLVKKMDDALRWRFRKVRTARMTGASVPPVDNSPILQSVTEPERPGNERRTRCRDIREHLPANATIDDILRVVADRVPPRLRAWIRHVTSLYDRGIKPCATTKRLLDIVLREMTDDQFIALHRVCAHACPYVTIALLHLSPATAHAQADVVRPEDRPLYVCTECGRLATSVVQRIPESSAVSSTAASTATAAGSSFFSRIALSSTTLTKTMRVRRGLKDSAYSFQWNAMFCNKRPKKSSGTRRRNRALAAAAAAATGATIRAVPKHMINRVLGTRCSEWPHAVIDRCGVLLRIGERVLTSCCRCGVMHELPTARCIQPRPICPLCIDREATARRETDRETEAVPTCFICSADCLPISRALQTVFDDDRHRFVQLPICGRHGDANGRSIREILHNQQSYFTRNPLAMQRVLRATERAKVSRERRRTEIDHVDEPLGS